MGHEAGARAEDGQIAAPLFHLPELVVDNGLAELLVADLQLAGLGSDRGVLDAGNLSVAPILKGLGRCGVMAVHINDHVISLSVTAVRQATLLVPSARASEHLQASPPVHFIFPRQNPARTANPITLVRDRCRQEIWLAAWIAVAMASPD